MPHDDHWMDEKQRDSVFSRRKADLRMSRTQMPSFNGNGTGGPSLIDRALGGNALKSVDSSSSQHFAIPTAGPAPRPSFSDGVTSSGGGYQPSVPPIQPAPVFVLPPAQPAVPPPDPIEHAEALAFYDNDTAAFNLRYLGRMLAYEMQRAHMFNRKVGVVVLSIDGFRPIGLNYGTMALDTVLQAVCAVLRNAFRPIDFVGRLSEDRFAVVCPEMPLEQLTTIANNVCKACSLFEIKHQWNTFNFTVSIGVAISSPEINDANSLLALADLVCDDAIEASGNGVCVGPESLF